MATAISQSSAGIVQQLPLSRVVETQVSVFEHKRWPYLFALPLMWIIALAYAVKFGLCAMIGRRPSHGSIFFDRFSPYLHAIREGATSWRALYLIYNYQGEDANWVAKLLSAYWVNMINAQAVRNRLRIVTRELETLIAKCKTNAASLTVYSICAGSAQGVITAIRNANGKGQRVRLAALDFDPTAIEHIEDLRSKISGEVELETILGNAKQFESLYPFEGGPDIIEMVGFLDYRRDESLRTLLRRIYEFLPSGGYFVTAHIAPNPEQLFLRAIINWQMIYRTPEQFKRELVQAGFKGEDIKFILEPHGIHSVAVCRKS